MKLPRLCGYGLVGGYVFFGLIFLLIRQFALPFVADNGDAIAGALSRSLGLRVHIGAISADWNGLRPHLHLRQLEIFDRQGRVALLLPQVEASVAWSSLLKASLELHRLEIDKPDLSIRREPDGRIFIAGLWVNQGGAQGGFMDFVLAQHQIVVRQARLRWDDMQRGSEPLVLEHLDFNLEKGFRRHRFALAADPPQAYSSRLDIRGDLHGTDPQRFAAWQGEIYANLERADLAVWRQWIDYPLELPQGHGALKAWVNFKAGRLVQVQANVALQDVKTRFAPNLPMLDLEQLNGRAKLERSQDAFTLTTQNLSVTMRRGLPIGPMSFGIHHAEAVADRLAQGSFDARHMQMQALAQFAGYLPLPQAWRERLSQAEPRGLIEKVDVKWVGESQWPEKYSLNANFSDLGVRPLAGMPGFSGLSGTLEGNERVGRFKADFKRGSLELPGIMREEKIVLDKGSSEGMWTREEGPEGQLRVQLTQARFTNADLDIEANGTYKTLAQGPGDIDLNARIHRLSANAAWRYIPQVVNDDVQNWLHQGLLAGQATEGHMRLRGDLGKFPFTDGKSGEFRIEAKISGSEVKFAPAWPSLTKIGGTLRFEGARMLIDVDRANYRDINLAPVKVEIPDLMTHEETLLANGVARGRSAEFLDYVRNSPVVRQVGRFIETLEAQGPGELELKLNVPLQHSIDTQVQGEYRFKANQLKLIPELPVFEQADGRLAFTENGVTLHEADARFLGGAVHASGGSLANGDMNFKAQGTFAARSLGQIVDWPMLWPQLSGQSDANANIDVKTGVVEVAIQSSLQGVESALPEPFKKTAESALPLNLVWRQDTLRESEKTPQERESWQLRLGGFAQAQWVDLKTPAGWVFARGAVGINDKAAMPERGLRIAAKAQTLDLDSWRSLFHASNAASQSEASKGSESGLDVLAGAALHADTVKAGGYVFRKFDAKVAKQEGKWVLNVESPEIAGDIFWSGAGRGRLSARLDRLSLVEAEEDAKGSGAKEDGTETAKEDATQSANAQTNSLPELDIEAGQFSLQTHALGRLRVQAKHRGQDWVLDKLEIVNADASLTGAGQWTLRAPQSSTQLDFKLIGKNAGNLLQRFGYANAMRRGEFDLSGKIRWRGMPTKIDYASLDGKLSLQVKDGQFNKLDPGVGRLLGILSLQALPRRITLDFRDVFSEGFAFDTIGGEIDIRQGIAQTQDLQIRGPAARIFMSGSTDLAKETQNLQVRVQPSLSESFALGASVVNPVVGIATYVAQKVLRDPLEKLFEYHYAITGTWGDPKVQKVNKTKPESRAQQNGNE